MAIKIFFCYSHEDEALLDKLKAQLKPLQREGFVDVWYDRDIRAGTEWEAELKRHLDAAQVVLLLVSPAFIASEYCYSVEMKRAMDRHKRGEACIIPIILRPCLWQKTPLGTLQALPTNALPVTSWHSVDEALADVASGVLETIKPLLKSRYERMWSVSSPGYLIFLLDQSAAMSSSAYASSMGTSERLCDLVTTEINELLEEIIASNTVVQSGGTLTVKPRAEISILGYGNGELHPLLRQGSVVKDIMTLPELSAHPISIEMRKEELVDDEGNASTTMLHYPKWVEPVAQGNACMCSALEWARLQAERWTLGHSSSYPPVVVNITSGIVSDGDPTNLANQLCQVSTSDGQTLLYNICISSFNHPPTYYPSSEIELPENASIRRLFSLSSNFPETNRYAAGIITGKHIPKGARYFILNGHLTLTHATYPFVTRFGTLPAQTSFA